MAKSKFFDLIKNASVEREVEDVYNQGLSFYFPNTFIDHPFACDGLITTKVHNGELLKLIIEYKYDKHLKDKMDRASILAQVVFYLKRFEENGIILPNICMVGDINECFVLHTNELLPFLDEEVDWSIAPSNAHTLTEFVVKIATSNINPYVWDVDESFSFKDVADKIIALAEGVTRYVRVTEHNISVIFEYFCKNVLKDASKIKANDLVSIFMGVITDKNNYYQHPTKKNELIAASRKFEIKGDNYSAFIKYFNINYTPKEKDKFSEIADRLIDDVKRRETGEFYTPTLFVDYAHRMIEDKLGEDWKSTFVVWDNCWGTGNLTRDYYFEYLYASTLELAELEIGDRYNKNSNKFQFDFLNDPLEGNLLDTSKIPHSLVEAFEQDRPFVFFINPPYGTAGSGDANGKSKEGCAINAVNKKMLEANIGSCSQNLYAQFLYKIYLIQKHYNLSKCYICLFSPTLFLCGSSWKNFRKHFLKSFNFIDGVQFQASHFSDVSDSWGISFSIWENGETINKESFEYSNIDYVDGEVKVVDTKTLYNTDTLTQTASDWCYTKDKLTKDKEIITAKSALNISNKTKKVASNLGFFINDTNNVDANIKGVYFMTMPVSRHIATYDITPENFERCTSLFAARKLIEKTWVNSKDEYLVPDENHKHYREFVNDSIIFSIFHSSSNQSSLRNVEFEDKKWNISNNFFWMSKQEMLALSNEYGLDFTYDDAKVSSERYVYQLLQNGLRDNLSDEAKKVLDKAIELTQKSMQFRSIFDESKSEYQILNWDCGFYQLKALWEMFCKEDFEQFKTLFRDLSNKMRPIVYELGFLKK